MGVSRTRASHAPCQRRGTTSGRKSRVVAIKVPSLLLSEYGRDNGLKRRDPILAAFEEGEVDWSLRGAEDRDCRAARLPACCRLASRFFPRRRGGEGRAVGRRVCVGVWDFPKNAWNSASQKVGRCR